MLKIFEEAIESLEEKYISVWEDICNIESQTADKAGVDAVGRYISDFAEKLGFKVEIREIEKSGNVIIVTMNENSTAAPFSLSGHMDTVHPKGNFGYPPVKIRDGKIYGPGVVDCKGGIVAALYAMEVLHSCGFSTRPIMLLLQSDEESGSSQSNKETISYICERAKDSIGFLNLEGFSSDEYCCIQRKGIVTYKFTVTGIEAHSSKCATQGANAILDAALKIVEIEKIKDDAGLTCSTGTIQGGSVPNTVAGSCEFKVNVRFATAEQREWIDKYVRELADTVHVDGCKCTVSVISSRLAMEYSEANVKFLEKINAALEKEGIKTMKGAFRKGGSDAAEITAAGIPCVDCLGVSGGEIHSALEFANIDSLKFSTRRIVAILTNVE